MTSPWEKAQVFTTNENDCKSYQIKSGDYFSDAQLINKQNYPLTVQASANHSSSHPQYDV